jgi:hypothetical protein
MELIDLLVNTPFQRAMLESDDNRREDAAKFAAFLDNDYDEIVKILKAETLDKPYKSSTQEILRWRHIDMVNKTLNRKMAGIFDNEPKITLGEDKAQNERLKEILSGCDFFSKVKRAIKRALFFNTNVTMPVMRDEKLEIDVIDPQYFIVAAKSNYYLIDKIAIQRTDEDNNVYWLLFTEDENYIIRGENTENVPVDEETDNEGRNPYSIIPVAVCRIKENGCDFYGEPNWNLYRAQIEVDAELTDMKYVEWMQKFGVGVSINLPIKDGQVLTPGMIISATKVKTDDATPSLTFAVPAVDWNALRDNLDWEMERYYNSEGIPNSSASVSGESPKQVGAKTIDEIELQESREDLKTVTYKFIIDLLNVIRVVWNTHNPGQKLNEKDVFEVEFSEEKPYETVQDKKTRREMEKENFIGNPVTFVMEDKELGEEEAKEYIKKVKEQNAELGLNSKQDTPIGGVASRILGRT